MNAKPEERAGQKIVNATENKTKNRKQKNTNATITLCLEKALFCQSFWLHYAVHKTDVDSPHKLPLTFSKFVGEN